MQQPHTAAYWTAICPPHVFSGRSLFSSVIALPLQKFLFIFADSADS